MRLLLIFLLLAAAVLVPFFIWGDPMMSFFSQEGSIAWLKSYHQWAWLAGMALLLLDLALPIPATVVMAALGYLYGPWIGGLLGAGGSFASGVVAYWLCRLAGDKYAQRLLGPKDYARGRRIFGQAGGWIVVLSRWLPVFPEVISCMAGLNRMPVLRFHIALLCSALPMGFVYALIGHSGSDHPTVALLLSIGLPPVIWLAVRPILRRKERTAAQARSGGKTRDHAS